MATMNYLRRQQRIQVMEQTLPIDKVSFAERSRRAWELIKEGKAKNLKEAWEILKNNETATE